MKLVYEQIEIKLQNAESICLIVDIWTNQVSADFIGLAVVLTNSFFEREILVINMMRMPGSHDAENIKYSIEKMINFFDFDKSKAKSLYFSFNFDSKLNNFVLWFVLGVICDQGSALVRLFSQIIDSGPFGK
jgi:hypothetical protein